MALAINRTVLNVTETVGRNVTYYSASGPALEYFMRPFSLSATIQILSQSVQHVTTQHDEHEKLVSMTIPFNLPRTGFTRLHVGFVQNVTSRRETMTLDTGHTLLVCDLRRRLLDVGEDHTNFAGEWLPFIYPPFEPPGVRQRPVNPWSTSTQPPDLLQRSGWHLIVYPNGHVIPGPNPDPSIERLPRTPVSRTFECRYDDHPGGEHVPLRCDSHDVTQHRASQTQQNFLAISEDGGRSYRPVAATTPYTTFSATRIIQPPRGRSHVSDEYLAPWYHDLAPWDEPDPADWPEPPRHREERASHDRRLRRWHQQRWRAFRTQHFPTRPTLEEGVVWQPPSVLRQNGFDTTMVTSGEPANAYLNGPQIRAALPPCVRAFQAPRPSPGTWPTTTATRSPGPR